MKFFGCIIFTFSAFITLAQSPTVPDRMEFAGIKLRIHESGRKDIQESVDALTRSPTYFQVQIEKAKSYFPIIERIFKEEGLPTDFKYLVLQESALIPDAVSSSDAVGYWQFKDFTAMEMGLRVDRHVDERMNIVSASRAAAQYLKKNNSFFDNWLHALQAYQMGPGGAMRVLKDEAGMKSMTVDKKTYWYVKKFLAHKVAFGDVVTGEPKVVLTEYKNSGGRSLKDIADEVGRPEDEIEAYNKWLKRGKIPSDKEYVVIIPAPGAVDVPMVASTPTANTDFEEEDTGDNYEIEYNLEDDDLFPVVEGLHKGFAEVNGMPGIVAKAGDKMTILAERGGVDLKQFLKYNDISIDHRAREGEVYYLRKKRAKAKTYYHVLQPNETLWEVSQKYGVRLKKIRWKNRIREDNPKLKPGRVLWLRYVRPASVDIVYREISKPKKIDKKATVKDKEEVAAATKAATATALPQPLPEKTEPAPNLVEEEMEEQDKEWGIKDSITVEEISEPGLPEKPIDSVKRIHAVAPGETFYAISKKYNVNVRDILEWNDLQINDPISIGQKLVVYEYSIGSDVVDEQPEEEQALVFIYHTVQPEDTLYNIARSYNVTVQEIMDLNDMEDFSISLGEKLKVGKKSAAQ